MSASFLILPLPNKKNAVICSKSARATGVEPAERILEARKMPEGLADATMPDLRLTRALKPHFPSKADRRLQELMDRNNEGLLDQSEREELEALVELSEQLSLVRGEALQILGKRP